jgi:peptide/nickel transport system substrate-binding protein
MTDGAPVSLPSRDEPRGADRRAFLRLAALVGAGAASGLLAAARAGAQPQTGMDVKGDLVVIQPVDAESLHPYITTNIPSRAMMQAMYDRLLERAPDMRIVPGLAVSYRAVGTSAWEFKLRDGVVFHNGEAFGAEHVKASVEHFLDKKINNRYRFMLEPVSRVEVVDRLTVRLHTSGPNALLPDMVASTGAEMLPLALTSGKSDPTKTAIGTGPYEFVEWIPGERMVMRAARRRHYSGQPFMKSITWRPVSEGAARLVELKTGRAHLINPINPVQVAEAQREPGLEVVRQRETNMMFLILNMAKPPFQDVRVRHAMNYATDVDTIISRIHLGSGHRLAGPWGPGVPGFDKSAEPFKYDPERARKLLAEAGVGGGFSVTLSTPNGRYLNDQVMCEAIAGMWEKVGVRTTVKTFEWGPYLQTGRAKRHDAYIFQQNPLIPHRVLPITLHSGVKGGPWQGYHNEEVNRLIDGAATTLDAGEREKMYARIFRIVREEAPWVFLYNTEGLYARSTRLRDWQAYPDTLIRLDRARLDA